jgi:hypothetical protein
VAKIGKKTCKNWQKLVKFGNKLAKIGKNWQKLLLLSQCSSL